MVSYSQGVYNCGGLALQNLQKGRETDVKRRLWAAANQVREGSKALFTKQCLPGQ